MDILKQLPFFTKHNLNLAMGKNQDNLNYHIKSLLKKGELIALKKGSYISSSYLELVSQNPVEREIYLEYLANILREPSYVSLEYVLSKCGMIPEGITAITSVTQKSTRIYQTKIGVFTYRKIQDDLFFGWEKACFKNLEIKIARLPKALFDFLYFKKFASALDMKIFLFEKSRLNFDVLSEKDACDFCQIVEKSKSKKMQMVARLLKKGGVLK